MAPSVPAAQHRPRAAACLQYCPVSNLHSALRKAVHACTVTGTSKKGIYACSIEAMYAGVDGDWALGP